MQARVFIRLAVLAVAGLALAGCASRPAPLSPEAPPARGKAVSSPQKAARLENANALAVENRAETLARYAAGIAAEAQGNIPQALAEFQVAASRDPANESLVLDVALRLLQHKHADKALSLLQQSAARTNASPLLLAHLGWMCAQTGRTNEALVHSRRAFALAPTNFLACQTLTALYLQQQQAPLALQVLETASRQTADAVFYIDLAELMLQFNRQAPTNLALPAGRPLELLQRAHRAPPEVIGYQFKLAELLASLGDTKSAVDLYLKLQEQFAQSPALRDGIRAKLAELYLRGDDRQQAMRQLEAIVKDHPLNPQAYYFLGSLAFEERLYAKAAEYFAQTLLLNPEFEPAYYDAAAALISTNRPAEALQMLNAARRKFPATFTLEYYTGLAHTRAKDYDQALKAYTAAEIIAGATEPQRLLPGFYFQVGAACERLKRYDEAETYFQKAIEKDPNFAEALNYLGYMWAERGINLPRAKELLERALKLEPKNAAFLDSMGWIYFRLGEIERARQYIEEAIALSEEPDATLHDHLGDIFAALSQWEQACAQWKKSLALEANEEIRKKLEDATARWRNAP